MLDLELDVDRDTRKKFSSDNHFDDEFRTIYIVPVTIDEFSPSWDPFIISNTVDSLTIGQFFLFTTLPFILPLHAIVLRLFVSRPT